MKRLLIILFCMPALLYAQDWNYTFGNDTTNQEGYSLVLTSDGNYALGGTTIWEGKKAMCLVKVNDKGEKLWQKIYDQNGVSPEIKDINLKETSNKGFIFGGNKLIKTNSSGKIEWVCNETYISSIIEFDSTFLFCDNKLIFSIDKRGEAFKEVSLNLSITSNLEKISSDKFIYISYSESYAHPLAWFQYYVTTLNKNGTFLQNLQFVNRSFFGNGSPYFIAKHLIKDEDSYILAGRFPQKDSLGVINGYFMSILKLNENKGKVWRKDYILNHKNYNYLEYIEKTHDNGFIVIGSGVIRLDKNGDTLWTRPDIDGNEIHQINDSSFILIRTQIDSITGDKNINIIKLNDSGEIIKVNANPTPPPNINGDIINIIDFSGRETKQKPNIPLIYIYDNGTAEKKMIIE